MRPDCSIIATGQITEFSDKSIAQSSRRCRPQRWLGGICLKFAIAVDSGALRRMAVATIQPTFAASLWFVGLRCLLFRRQETRSIEVIFAGNPDQGEQGIAPRIG